MIIQLHIPDPLSRSYIRSVFTQNTLGHIEINNTSLIGTAVCFACKPSETNPVVPASEEVLTFVLPTSSKYTTALFNKYLRITKEGQRLVNNAIRREFDTTLLCYCNTKIATGCKLNDAIYSFMADYDLIDETNFETVKKRHYRIRREVSNDLHEHLRRKFYELSKKYSKK